MLIQIRFAQTFKTTNCTIELLLRLDCVLSVFLPYVCV